MREKKEKKPQRFQEVSTEGSALSENGCKTVIVDTETGVHYLHIKCGYSGSITPLYNADGTMAEYCQSSAGILTYFKEIWQDYAVKIPYLCAVRDF